MKRKLVSNPFFLVYDSRSGSTYLANALIRYANAAIPPEADFVTLIFNHYPGDTVPTMRDVDSILDMLEARDIKFCRDWNLTRREIRDFVEESLPISVKDFILSLMTIYRNKFFPQATLFGLKNVHYLKAYEKIKQMFPRCLYVGIVRDGRAVFLSRDQGPDILSVIEWILLRLCTDQRGEGGHPVCDLDGVIHRAGL